MAAGCGNAIGAAVRTLRFLTMCGSCAAGPQQPVLFFERTAEEDIREAERLAILCWKYGMAGTRRPSCSRRKKNC